jgi:parvulin-like peptidyl-prolyl isomerase
VAGSHPFTAASATAVQRRLWRRIGRMVCLAMLAMAAETAAAQRLANQFNEQAAGATRGPVQGFEQQHGVDTSVARPFVPKSTSRPESWPSDQEQPGGGVVSSIRSNPGSPLVPVDGPSPVASEVVQALAAVPLTPTSEDSVAGEDRTFTTTGSEGVVQTQYVEPATAVSPYPSTGYAAAVLPGVQDAGLQPPSPRIADGFSQPAGLSPAIPQQPAASPQTDPLLSQAQSLQTAMVVARVGPEVVLESDLITPSVAEWLEKVTPTLKPEQIRELKLQVYRHLLTQHIESLIVYVDACRTIPEDALPEIEAKVNQAFDAEQLPKLMEAAKVANSMEYEQVLRSRGQSLDRLKKAFFERAIAQQWMQQALEAGAGGEIPHAELIAYYQEHLEDYEYPAKATFEELCVRFGGGRSREQAWGMLAALGNRVLSGEPFADVARQASEGPTASQGGSYDWTSQGSLRSDVIDEAIFSLPVGKLSTILEDDTGLHILRVTERTDAGRTSFLEAQVAIRETLRMERHKKAVDDYLAKLRDRTPVWTIFDDEDQGQQATSMAGPTAGGR